MNLAPIALFAYNRLSHLQQTIAALKANEFAPDSVLVIYSDAARTETDKVAVTELRNYLKTVDGFNTVSIIERSENFGLARSVIDGVSSLVTKYGKVIVLEDDLVTSKYFLRYMNEGLNYYQNDDRVISIHGYTYPVKGPLPETFLLRGADCWGWGTWARGWDLFEEDALLLLTELSNKGLNRKFDFDGSYPYTKMLMDQVDSRINSWAIRWHASAFLKNKLTLYPCKSLVMNIGNDASGTHCSSTKHFDVELTDNPINIGNIPVEVNINAERSFKQYFRSLKKSLLDRMLTSFKKRYKKAIPFSVKNKPGYYGNYASWEDALLDSGGYDNDLILEKVTAAMIQVRDGNAAYERDSVLFDTVQYSWPLLSSLLWIASQNGNNLNVIDFGGSLGSSFFQNKLFLNHLNTLNWSVIEQDEFVKRGRSDFTNFQLNFHNTIDECLEASKYNVILFASVLPYLPKPFEILDKVIEQKLPFIIIDRTPVLLGDNDRLTVQRVPESIYKASYPAWFFSQKKLFKHLAPHYDLITEFDSLVSKINLGNCMACEKGFLFKFRGYPELQTQFHTV